MSAKELLFFLAGLWPFGFLKIFTLILMLFYIVFAFIVFRQVELMNEMVEAQISPALRLIAMIHLGAALLVFLIVLLLL